MNFHKCFKPVIILIMAIFIISVPVMADNVSLTDDSIEEMRRAFKKDLHNKAVYNAVTNTDINSLALNRDLVQKHNDVFSHKIKIGKITDQKSSGRCWIYAGLNIIRPLVMEKYNLKTIEFSQNYMAFWDKMEKANIFLEYIIEFRDRDPLDRELTKILRNPFPDGGYWEYVVALTNKYGVVPKEVMPESNSSGKTKYMNRLVNRKLRADAVRLRQMHQDGISVADIRNTKKEMLKEIYGMLAINLGEPPTKFSFRYENRDSVVSEIVMYTPRKFYRDFIGIDLGEYIQITNDPSHEYGKHYEINMTKNMFEMDNIHFPNVEIEILKTAALKSVLDDLPTLFSCDVGKDQNRDLGIMAMDIYDYNTVYGIDMNMSKTERMLFRESAPNHGMVFIGVDVQNGEPVKWLVENSWGDDVGDDGYWALYDSWFDNFVYSVYVKKQYIPEEVLDILKQDKITLPVWDPIWDMMK